MTKPIMALIGLFCAVSAFVWVFHNENAENLSTAATMQAAIEKAKTERMKLKIQPGIERERTKQAGIHQKTALIITAGLIAAVALAGLAIVIFALLSKTKTIIHVTATGPVPERIEPGDSYIEIPGRGKNRLIHIGAGKGETRYV